MTLSNGQRLYTNIDWLPKCEECLGAIEPYSGCCYRPPEGLHHNCTFEDINHLIICQPSLCPVSAAPLLLEMVLHGLGLAPTPILGQPQSKVVGSLMLAKSDLR